MKGSLVASDGYIPRLPGRSTSKYPSEMAGASNIALFAHESYPRMASTREVSSSNT